MNFHNAACACLQTVSCDFMKTEAEIKFEDIIKKGFHEVLKPLGFKKKGNNFYIQRQGFGQIINIQKSNWRSKNDISFTINIGLFLPEYWSGMVYNQDKPIPDFPTEPECVIRRRIGSLRKQHDTWYDVTEKTDNALLIAEMKMNLEKFILPYFNNNNSKEQVLTILESEPQILSPLSKLVVYGELKQFDKAKLEYHNLLETKKSIPAFVETVKEYGKKYGVA